MVLFQCNFHHSVIYHYCPSNVDECGCRYKNEEVFEDVENYLQKLGGHVSICSDLRGYVYLVSSCVSNHNQMIISNEDVPKTLFETSFDPSCETFKLVKNNDVGFTKIEKSGSANKMLNENESILHIVSGAMVVVIENETDMLSTRYLTRFGGWEFISRDETRKTPSISKGIYSYVYCQYDLQEYHESTDRYNIITQTRTAATDSSHFKSGHSKIVTELASLDEPPNFNSEWDVYDLQNNVWLDNDAQQTSCTIKKCSMPFSVGDAATIVVGQNLYVIGGYKVENDKDWTQNLLYQVKYYSFCPRI